ncbi:AI-2 transport protein TqsA [Jeotgalibaca dankookensis]|uniref:AI-2 transport protein TqsA n=1 Tax=Jeotgalibaca dankookensis TaxID=708126 RepID=A0A1S6IQV3_9LACT|nr:AI-2E family transporter [Jeotgalibaca dankookensis]AQS53933.1 AI-2 transport protein TqsA [Jeotgalibaca dankookensis]
MVEQEKKSSTSFLKSSKFMQFFGGKNLLFSLTAFILIGLLIMVYQQIAFIFYPLRVIFSTIVTPIVLAIIFFYILNPLVSFLEKKKIGRIWGTIIAFLGVILLIAAGILSVVPILTEQITDFASDFPEYIQGLNQNFKEFFVGSQFETYFNDMIGSLDSRISEAPGEIWNWISSSSQQIFDVFSTISNVVVAVVTFPIILFFMLADRGKFKPFIMQYTPPVFRKDLVTIGRRISEVLSSYVVGVALVALSLGVILFFGYLIIGLDYAFVLAVIATITAVIPFIGATIGIIPAIIVAAFTSPAMLIKMIVVWVVAQAVQGNIIEPNIMGKKLKIHPLTIIIVLLIMGNLLGIVGMILGVPIFAVAQVLFEYIFNKFRKHYNRYYGNVAGRFEIEEE